MRSGGAGPAGRRGAAAGAGSEAHGRGVARRDQSSATVGAVDEPKGAPGKPEGVEGDLPVAATSLIAMSLTAEQLHGKNMPTMTGAFIAEAQQLPQTLARYRLPLRTWSVPLLLIAAVVVIFYLLSFWLNVLTSRAPEQVSLVDRLLNQTLAQAQNTVSGLGEVMAAVLGLALTVSSIIVQLAATRFTPHITSLFFRARTNILVLGFFVVSTVFVVWVNFSLSGDQPGPRWDVLFSMLFMTASLLLLFPYFAYVFDFLDPEKIVGRITANGLYACTPLRGKQAAAIDQRQLQAIEAVEHLTNIGLNALQQKDKNITSSAIDALCKFTVLYGETKAGMLKDWHRIPQWNRQSPDFVSLSNEAIHDLRERGTWLEWKVLRQYQMLFTEGLSQIKDICYLIAINTRRLGEAAARRGDLHALDLAIKFFNTYLRATINASDIRTAYNILHQYRQLAETVLRLGRGAPASAVDKNKSLEQRAIDVARYMRYYSGEAFRRNMAFIAVVIAHDVGTLCAWAFQLTSKSHDELLKIFLGVDDATESAEQEKTLRGVRQAQIKLATHYLTYGAVKLAKQIADDMVNEDRKRLRSMWAELEKLDTREFWEVNDRGSNFDYLTPDQKAKLPRFFAWFDGLSQGPDGGLSDSQVLRP